MIGSLIRDARIALGISLRTLADLFGVTPLYLGEVERGRRVAPKDWERRLAALRTLRLQPYPESRRLLEAAGIVFDPSAVKAELLEHTHESPWCSLASNPPDLITLNPARLILLRDDEGALGFESAAQACKRQDMTEWMEIPE